ncbi:MAG TPA: fumarylacetoacetate hydrolase family protein [Marinagarivorans sp.]
MIYKTSQPRTYSLPLHDKNNKVPYHVRRLICIGRNYAEHAKEMGHEPAEAPPFFFYKPLTALCNASQPVEWTLPAYSHNVHYELEVSVAIGSQVTASSPESAICGIGLALDMTCRDIQQTCKAQGRPWETAKGFDFSAPCSALHSRSWQEINSLGKFSLLNNGKPVQQGTIKDMIWSIPELLRQLSEFTELDEGDLILTGTPAGVGQVQPGDQLRATFEGLACELAIDIKA